MFDHLSSDELVAEAIAAWSELADELEAIADSAVVRRVNAYTRATRARSRRLVCVECGRVDDGGHGWTLRFDCDENLVAFCPEHDAQEFGHAD